MSQIEHHTKIRACSFKVPLIKTSFNPHLTNNRQLILFLEISKVRLNKFIILIKTQFSRNIVKLIRV